MISPLAKNCQEMLSSTSKLSKAIPGFVVRTQQIELAIEIANAIDNQSILVAEAGTGTGKTFAYLLPCLLSGKKALISTATKTLQDQLFLKDLPLLIKALGLPIRIQNLKGRANYICQHRVLLHAEEGIYSTIQSSHEITHVKNKLSQMVSGDRSELPEISENSPIWSYITSTGENCLGGECPHVKTCFLVKARQRALEANIVVINHHLFFADSQLKQEGLNELLPGVDVVIFDEAHQLPETAIQFYDKQLSTRQFKELLEDIIHEWPLLQQVNQPFKQLSFQFENIINALCSALPQNEDRYNWQEIKKKLQFMTAWKGWFTIQEELLQCFSEEQTKDNPGLQRCKERLLEMRELLFSFDKDNKERIHWTERFKHHLAVHATPYEIADSFNNLLQAKSCAYVFTSATLTVSSSFESFCKPLGLKQGERLLLPSPFDFQQQALLYLPRGLPDPNDLDYHQRLLEKVLPIINACKGRCFFLFTSHKALKQVAQLIGNTVQYPILIQGDESKSILLARFRQLGNAVLLGTSTFWEGVDVRGETLSCVIIDKIPFASPHDPVISGRMAYLKQRGLSGFNELSLPNAIMALKQGVGRLIRDINDRGILVIGDPRLTARPYGKVIFQSLPPVLKTRDEQKALQFIKEFTKHDETISH